jgi:hypothetical protein
VASLMRELSLPVDGSTVRDQTVEAGSPNEALPGRAGAAKAVPVTVEMEARFDAIFAMLRAAELSERLVRVTSVHLACDREVDHTSDEPLITASVGMDAIYLPSGAGEAP